MNTKDKILISVGHSKKVKGASNESVGVHEYDLCKKIASSAAEMINKSEFKCEFFDIGDVFPYRQKKIDFVNKHLDLALAIEFHLNSYPGKTATYSSCFFMGNDKDMAELSECILGYLKSGLYNHGWNKIKSVGLPSDGYDIERYWFVTKAKCPAMIVEPLFISNDEQAMWLKTTGACEAVGMIIAEGILKWMRKKQNTLNS